MRWIAIGCVAVVLFDTIAAVAARTFDFEYAYFSPVSLAMYATAAFLAARAERSIRVGALAGAALALTGVMITWPISWAIGPGALDEGDGSAGTIVGIGLGVVATGAVIGLLAGSLHRLRAFSRS